MGLAGSWASAWSPAGAAPALDAVRALKRARVTLYCSRLPALNSSRANDDPCFAAK